MTRKPKATTAPLLSTRNRRRTLMEWFHEQSNLFQSIMKGVTALGFLIGAIFAINSHFASANDVTQLRSDISRSQLNTEIAIANFRRAQVMDKIHDLSSKENALRGRLPPHERQALERFRTEYGDLTKDIEAKKRLADRLQYGR